jgi:tRNA threonylcarbamoyl adenosine modification protein YeaZ
MNILFLDTASKENILALCTEHTTLLLTHLQQKVDAVMIEEIEKLMEKAKCSYSDLTHLACVIGPGGFTSLRVGVTVINTLAYALSLPSAGIHLSELWRERVIRAAGARGHAQQNFFWLHSTRRMQLFVKGFSSDGTIMTPSTMLDLEDARTLRGPYVGELIDDHTKVLNNCHPILENNLLSLKEVLPTFLVQKHYEKKQLLPWYGRDPN